MGLSDKILIAMDRSIAAFQRRRKEMGHKPEYRDLEVGEPFLDDRELGEAVRICGDTEELWRLFLARGKPIRAVMEFGTIEGEEGRVPVHKKWTVEVTYRAAEVKIRTTTKGEGDEKD